MSKNNRLNDLSNQLNNLETNTLKYQLEKINTENNILNYGREAIYNKYNNNDENQNKKNFEEYLKLHPNEKEKLQRYLELTEEQQKIRNKKNRIIGKEINNLKVLEIKNDTKSINILKKKLEFLKENNLYKQNFNKIIKIITNKYEFINGNNKLSLKARVDFLKTQLIILDEIKKDINSGDIRIKINSINNLMKEKKKLLEEKKKLLEEKKTKGLKNKVKEYIGWGSSSSVKINNLEEDIQNLEEEIQNLEEEKRILSNYHMTNQNKNAIINEIKKEIKEIIKFIKEKGNYNNEEEKQNNSNEETALLNKKNTPNIYIPRVYPKNNQYNLITTIIREKKKELNKLSKQRNEIALSKSIWKSVPSSLIKKINTIKNEIKRLELNKNILKESKKKI